MPAAKPSRQEVMNAGPHHAKIRVTAHVPSSVYVAGSEVSGKMDVECRAEKGLGLGTIMVELIAFQELNSRDHAATSTFIHTRRVFQGPGLPPSNAVLPEDEKGIFPPHHFPARRGITTFYFRFPLPLTSPASVDFGSGLAKIRYEIRASSSVAWKGERRLVTDSQEIQVVESAMQEVESAGTVVGESGKIWVQGKVLGGAVIAGQTCCIELHVKNHSPRKTTGVNVTLQRMLHLDNPPPQHANLILSDTLVTAAFHSAEYCCPPGLEGIAKLVINVPRTARTVKGGSRESGEASADKAIPALFDIRGSVNVRLCMGVGAKDLELNLPVVISHPAALAAEAQSQGPLSQDSIQMGAPSLYEPSHSPFPPSHSPVLSQPTGYSSYHLAASPTLPYTQLYFPPPSPQMQILNQFPAPPTSPSLPMSPVLQMSPGHRMSPMLSMSPVHPMSPVLPVVPGPPMTPVPSMSPVQPYPHTTSPVHAYHGQPQFQQPQVYSPPRSPVHSGTARSPQSPRRALPQPPQRKPQSKPKGPAPNPPPLPPRPTSAEPHVHEVGVDLPPANLSSNTPLSPSAGRIQAPAEVPDPVEGKGTRASRISEHLKMSSRTRSMSPTGRRFPGPPARPAPVEPPPPEGGMDMEAGVLDPRAVHTALAEVMDRAGNSDGGPTRARVQDFKGMVVEDEVEDVVRSAKVVQGMDRKSPERSPRKSEQSQPPPGPRGGRENRSPARALPRPPPRAGDVPQDTPPMSPTKPNNKPPISPMKLPHSISAPVVASQANDPPTPIVKPLQPEVTGLTALERRLTTKLERPPLPPTSLVRKPVLQPEQSAPPPNEEPTIDWGEIARIGKLKSFAATNKKPIIPAFTVPEIPSASFVKPKPTVVRKPVPSMDEDEDLPILPAHRTPASSHPPSPRNAPVPVAEVKPLMRYELTDNPMPKAMNELDTPRPLASAARSPSRPSAQLPSQPSQQPASFPIIPQSPQEVYRQVPSSPSRPKLESRPASFQSDVSAHVSPSNSHPPSPQAMPSPMAEAKPIVRYELSDNPVPKTPSQPGTPKSVTSAIQLPSQPPAQPPRAPAQRASVPIPPRPSQEQFSQPTPTPPQSRPASRPASVAVASSPAAEPKPLVRYKLTDNPVPKPPLRPKVVESTSPPARIPVQAPIQPKVQATPWPRSAGRPQSVAIPPQPRTQGSSRHAAFTVISSPVIETQPLGPSDLTYEPISFTPIQPNVPDTTRDIPQSPIRSPPSPAKAAQLPQENVGQPTASPTRPKPESRSQSWAPAPAPVTAPMIPNHVPRYQLSDSPVSKAPVRYQLDDPPISKPQAVSPAPAPASGPEAILTNHRANLRPVSSAKQPPQPKVRPRTPPSPIPAASVPLPQSPIKVAVPSRPVPAPRPAPPPFPRFEDRVINPVPPAPTQPTSPKRRDPSPRRTPQPPIPADRDVFGGEHRVISNPQKAAAESQAAQKAKYFESLSAAKRNIPPEKPQPAPQNTRQILQPQQANTSQPILGTRHVQVQIQPTSQPQPSPRVAPIRAAPSPLEISSPRPLPSPRAVYTSPILSHDMPLRSPSPVFTANPVPPTLPTARSLIPHTSSGFEVPAVLPGRDARERADAALREAELFRLKREAITRVPMWIGNEYSPQPPPPTRVVRSFNVMDLPPQSYWDIQQPSDDEFTVSELLSRESTPVGRAAYDPQLKHPRPRPVSSKPPPALLPSDKELLNKHNIQQSARGGRGGQVTSVTSIWEHGKDDLVPVPAAERKPQAKRYTAPVGMFGITAKGFLPNEEPSAGMIKSTSVPAMVYTHPAVPSLSSTASLARPVGSQSTRARIMPFAPTIPESQSDDALMRKTSQSSDNIPVGQARLRELIGKYQS
ncbi:unnamed protein product [Rhizoctonia solani]|uniref:Arrestin C-terminal-like domain-containing protein n=1 Tax=Rhizoctonia solani TaxID=456999 RepID=A0A8H3GXV3_9AGAM|nr:unnamed protein product [Rhizoctonia solani]